MFVGGYPGGWPYGAKEYCKCLGAEVIFYQACRSAKSDKVSDSTVKSIDRFFDWLDSSVEAADRVLNRHKYTEEQHHARRSKQPREVIDATPESSPKPKAKAASSTPSTGSTASTAVAKKPHYYIAESVDPKSGRTIFVVTDGGNARAECTSRELAGQILRALEKK